ncbi:MAG: L-glutamate gamma-semialdehyde dehydrogenase [Ignavibacteriae bacterium]|nr:L-glutamate gamma-semialdehyde dehydrogenase [Ignavibacteriota bacterium]NOH00250.1 L-glutamate gamma-semialdehyde dehydrogenase [Ignavibacteriota bacterium]
MSNAIFNIPLPPNDPISSYKPGSIEKESLKARIVELKSQQIEIPVIIGGKNIKTGKTGKCVIPHDHKKVIGVYHKAGEKEVNLAIKAALEARESWAAMPWNERTAIFLRAADLLTTPYWRNTINAATILGQSKNAFQAEIDAACELVDFFRFNVYYAQQIYKEQPLHSPNGIWNRMEYRPLEGFVFAVSPFNFTSIAGNLPTAPALMGNVALMKPASSAVYSGYWLMKLFKAAGVPDGVINFIPGSGSQVGNPVMKSPYLAGIHFTGSTPVFQNMWKTVGDNIAKYKSYPRIVGETGGKDFVVVHKSADPQIVATALIRGAFEYQGQKCSAASRAYIPKSKWDRTKRLLIKELKTVKMGDPEDFTNFMNAVIDQAAFDTITGYIKFAKRSKDAQIIFGGNFDDSKGYFIEPTVILAKKPKFKTMEEEIFGPVLTIYVYEDKKYEETLHLCDQTSEYALTGAIFADDRDAVQLANKILVNAAGNFYINDKPTGAVVGQQPFGGARASGTNDKAGSYLNLIRWVSPRTIKENFIPPADYRYPFMEEK